MCHHVAQLLISRFVAISSAISPFCHSLEMSKHASVLSIWVDRPKQGKNGSVSIVVTSKRMPDIVHSLSWGRRMRQCPTCPTKRRRWCGWHRISAWSSCWRKEPLLTFVQKGSEFIGMQLRVHRKAVNIIRGVSVIYCTLAETSFADGHHIYLSSYCCRNQNSSPVQVLWTRLFVDFWAESE
jgi:hypothetical protein